MATVPKAVQTNATQTVGERVEQGLDGWQGLGYRANRDQAGEPSTSTIARWGTWATTCPRRSNSTVSVPSASTAAGISSDCAIAALNPSTTAAGS